MSISKKYSYLILIAALLLNIVVPTTASVVHAQQDPPRAHPALLQLADEHPDDTFMVIVQREVKNKDLKDDEPEIAVVKAGGKVKKQLQMVQSFSAELTGKEIEKLAEHPKVRWLSFDAPLVSTAAGDPYVRDDFSAVSFANNQGTVQWLGNWIENDPEAGGAGASVGQVQVISGALRLDDNPDTGGQPSAARQVNLSGATAATLRFDYRTDVGVDPDDAVVVEVSNNGGSTFTVLETFTGVTGQVISTRSYDITNFIANNTMIRFRVSNLYGAIDEYFYVDNVQVEFTQSTTALLTAGLVGYWNYDVNADDFSGNNYNGTLANGASINTTTGTNKIGSGKVSFDGVNDYIDLSAHRANIATLAQGTIAMWIKTTSTQDELFSLSDNADTDSVAALWLGANGKISFEVWENNSSLLIVNSVASVNDGQWRHVAVTVDATGNKLYINGNQASVTYGKGNSSSTTFMDDVSGIDIMGMGRNVNNSGGRFYYNGMMDDVRVYNRALSTAELALLAAASPIPANYTGSVRATTLRQQMPSLNGQGIGVAVVDSGIANHSDLQGRIVVNNNQTAAANANDDYEHGTHVAGIIGGNGAASNGLNMGMAPGVNLINVKVSNDQGVAITSDLIDGLQWILNNKATYNIKVVNISLNSTVPEPYHTSALDAAVEILWFNGITVVVAAGNNGTGSGAVTLYPPANDPFVITVGATEDKGTPLLSDDTLAIFSAYGTTESGFAKPDLVAPGRSLISLLASTNAKGFIDHPAHRVDNNHFRMSGTSMAAPVVSGAVALLLQDEPGLTPDQVKYRLKATANTTWSSYNATKAGAGYLDTYAAIYGTSTQSANTGLTVSQMLTTGSNAVNSTVNWNSVNWNSVNWNSVNWNSVNWNSVNWNAGNWTSSVWDDEVVGAAVGMNEPAGIIYKPAIDEPTIDMAIYANTMFLPLMIGNSTTDRDEVVGHAAGEETSAIIRDELTTDMPGVDHSTLLPLVVQ